MLRIFHYRIPVEQEGRSILDYLSFLGYSGQNITQLKKQEESILLNGKWAYVRERLTAGDELTVRIEEKSSSPNIVPRDLPIDIVYEDEDILVLNKSADMPIHPSQNHYEDTLANAVMYYYESQDIPYVFRCLNRLDRETSGLTILAKNMVSGAILSRMVKNREIKREYIALVEGDIREALPCNAACLTGTIDRPIGRKEGSTIERIIDEEHGERAVTHYELIEYDAKHNFSVLRVWLETGRTHQIRVHMSSIGHPLLGDYIYNPENHAMTRQALHSYRLTFLHPITQEKLCFCVEPPEDMQCRTRVLA